MSANRRTGTKPELALRSALHGRGYRFRKDFRVDVPGLRVRPDIVFTRLRVAVFVDGCFWHACPEHGRPPTHNEWYWGPKLHRNVKRDAAVTGSLEQAGWRVVRIWEHMPVSDAVTEVEGAIQERGGQLRLARVRQQGHGTSVQHAGCQGAAGSPAEPRPGPPARDGR